ncbi:isoamylase early set domain-containing protein [Streptomyces sp. NPDC058655]|uniref:isoamylase early set domain-containing protein n=1 Tax=Streptomyces sp. NPDC058655 TaxID=3346577 RepID=UPI0036553265
MLERKQLKDRTQVTFVLPAEAPPGPVSVVGDFNDWQPGIHTLEPRKDGMRAVTVALPGKSVHSFRYLAAGDRWFDEDHADGHDGTNSRLHT